MFEPVKGNQILTALRIVAVSSLIRMTTILAKMLWQGFDGESLHPLQASEGSMIKYPKATQE